MFPRSLCNRLLLAILLLVSSCQLIPQRPSVVQPADADKGTQPPAPNPHQKEIDRLLRHATSAFNHYRLTTPLNDNAYFLYLRVLSLDPANRAAQQGIYDIAEKYIEWAIDSANTGQFKAATDYLNKARSVDEKHPNILAVENLINEKQHANRMTYYLSTAGLDQKTAWMTRELMDIARKAEKQQATTVITSRNDAEGRWIYQQMNEATEARIRARLEIGNRPNVRLVFH